MEQKKTTRVEDKLEKDLKTIVSRMKSENSALKKILIQLKANTELPEEEKSNPEQKNQ